MKMKNFKVNRHSDHLNITFSATLENIDQAALETKQFLIGQGLNKLTFSVVLCMREALTNAVVGGCGKNPNKTVAYSLSLENDHLILEVEDEGDGFEWRSHLDRDLPTIEESGRGMFIMKSYFSHLQYNEKGNKLTLKREV